MAEVKRLEQFSLEHSHFAYPSLTAAIPIKTEPLTFSSYARLAAETDQVVVCDFVEVEIEVIRHHGAPADQPADCSLNGTRATYILDLVDVRD